MEMQIGFKQTRFGRLHYAEKGAGDPLLLLHSNGCSRHEFDETIEELSAHYRCIAWDMPAHGDSEGTSHHLSVADYAHAVVAFMDAMGIERAHVCGASIGGHVCAVLGANFADRITSLVIAEAALRTGEQWADQWQMIETMFSIPQQGEEELAPRVRNVTPALLERWNIDRGKAGAWRMMDVMWALREFDAYSHFARIQSPWSAIIGTEGPCFQNKADYEQLLCGAPITVMENAGHFPMIDDPAAFAAAVHAQICSMSSTTAATIKLAG